MQKVFPKLRLLVDRYSVESLFGFQLVWLLKLTWSKNGHSLYGSIQSVDKTTTYV